MSNLPLVNVTALVNDQQGRPCAGAVVKMRLCSPDKYQGLVVPREVTGVTDAAGRCVLRVFPNALGYEGSVYDVHISFPGSGEGVCGRHAAPGPIRPIRQKVFVPNNDCNLMDIMDLSPREPLPAGTLIPGEVAGYAAQAADSAAAAKSHAEAASSILALAQSGVDRAEAAKEAALAAESNAVAQARRAKQLVDGVDETICNFRTSVTTQVEKTAALLVADATRCIREQEAVSLSAIELRSGEALHEISGTAAATRGEAVEAIRNSGLNAVHAVEDARDEALEDLRETGAQFEEDFLTLTERAESAAKRAGCSAAGAANSATKACACAERAETAAQGLERYRDDALDAARRAETAGACAKADAQRAEAAADGVEANARAAVDAATISQKNARAAAASAALAKNAADAALEAKTAVAADRAVVENIANDAKGALLDAAATIISDEIKEAAAGKATADANAARDAAIQAKQGAETARDGADAARQQAETARAGAESARDAAAASRDAAAQSALNAAAKAEEAATVVLNLDDGIEAATPRPFWDGTKLGFRNTKGSIEIPAVDVRGETGEKGDAATIAVGNVTALEPGATPVVENVGDAHAAVFNFSIPRGEQGGSATVTVGGVESLAPGTQPEVINTGTARDAVLTFKIPKGDKGDTPELTADYSAGEADKAFSAAGAKNLHAEAERAMRRANEAAALASSAMGAFSPATLFLANIY